MPSVFGARRRLTTSATATTYGHSARSSHNPRRDEHLDALPFLYLPRPLPCGSGDRRRAAQRPSIQTPVPVPPGFHQVCPTAIPAPTRHLRGLPRRVLVAIDVHGSEDQEKDASSAERERHVSVFLRSGACASKSACGRRSLPRRPLDIRCRRCVRREGRRPVLDAGPNQDPRSDADPRRSTPSREPGCLPPLRSRQASARRIAPPNESCASVPRSRRPHFFPKLGRVPSWALQAPECGHPRSLAFEVQAPLLPMGSILSNLSCLGLTTQARPSARPSWLVCES
jgi:hypothetical protein